METALKPIKPLYRRNKIVAKTRFFGISEALNFLIRTSLFVEADAKRIPLANSLRKIVEIDASKNSDAMTQEILNHLNERIIRRIAKL